MSSPNAFVGDPDWIPAFSGMTFGDGLLRPRLAMTLLELIRAF